MMQISMETQSMAAPNPDWQQTTWNGEKAWESTSSEWTAIVSEERSRLVSIARTEGGANLLYASPKTSSSWGGHRCWLGPQTKWKANWPPPADWEASAAADIKVFKTLLTVSHPHADADYPALTRSYQWRDGVLHCGVSWQGDYHHAIHILQVPQWSIIHVRRAVQTVVPLGYSFFDSIGNLTNVDVPAGISRTDGDDVTLWHANTTAKIAFSPQEITADIGDYQLKMRHGKLIGVESVSPDLGLLTQIYLGDWQNPFVEIEQLSPFGSKQPAVCEILVEPTRKNVNPTP